MSTGQNRFHVTRQLNIRQAIDLGRSLLYWGKIEAVKREFSGAIL